MYHAHPEKILNSCWIQMSLWVGFFLPLKCPASPSLIFPHTTALCHFLLLRGEKTIYWIKSRETPQADIQNKNQTLIFWWISKNCQMNSFIIWKSFEGVELIFFSLTSENWGLIKRKPDKTQSYNKRSTESSVHCCVSLDMYWFMYWGHSTLSTLTYQLRKHWSEWGD